MIRLASSRFVLAIVCLGSLGFARAAPCASTILVKKDGTGDSTSIQGGINIAQPGDTVLVFPGVYQELVHVDREIVLRSNDGCRNTVIDATGLNGAAVSLDGPLTATTVLEGFAIRGGNGSGVDAGGVVVAFCSPVVRGNIVYRNLGSGMSARGAGTPLFEANQVVRNQASGFLGWAARATLRGNRLLGNGGSGIEYYNDLPAEISGNLIARNGSAGIYAVVPSGAATSEVRNNTITRNREGVQLDYFADQVTLRRNLITKNRLHGITCGSPYNLAPACDQNDVWGNVGGDYDGPLTTPTDISANPLCCGPVRMDYQLQAASPCVLSPTDWIGAFGVGCP